MNEIYSLDGKSVLSPESTSNLIARVSRIEKVVPYRVGGGSFAPSDFTPLDSGGIVKGKLNLTVPTAISFKGSMSPAVVDGNFAATATTTTITWYWDGTNSSKVIVLRRADGTGVTIPGSSITITGLTAAQTYTYFPCWQANGNHQIGWAGPGDTGTPAIAFSSSATQTQLNQAAAFQVRSGVEPLTAGGMTFAQPAAGTSGGTGGGGGTPGKCVLLGTDIEPLEPNMNPADWKMEQFDNQDWITITTARGLKLTATPNHPVYSEKGKAELESLKLGQWLVTVNGFDKLVDIAKSTMPGTKVQVSMKYGHLYWGNGFLCSNLKWNP